MKTERLARLEGWMGQWIDEESIEGFPYLISYDLHIQMAKAAAAVFDATMSGQEFAEKN